MKTKKDAGKTVHVMVQGQPVSGRKAVGAKQAKSLATREKPVTLKQPSWMQKDTGR